MTLVIANDAVVAFLPLSSAIRRETEVSAAEYDPSDIGPDSISILKPGVRTVLSYSLAATFVPVMFSALLMAHRTGYLSLIAAAVGYVGLSAAAFLAQTVNNLGAWTEHGRVTVDGKEYVFLDTSFLQGQTMTLGERQPDNLLYRNYRALVSNNGDNPRSWASIVRPTSAVDQYGQLYLAPGNLLVGVRTGNHCYLAFELPNQKRIGHEAIESISPFICLDTTSTMLTADVAATLHKINERIAYCAAEPDVRPAESFLAGNPSPGVPARAAIENELKNPNPAIAAAAQQMLDALLKGDATLNSKLDVQVQKIPPFIFAPFSAPDST